MRTGGDVLIVDKGYASEKFAAAVRRAGCLLVRPARADEPDRSIRPAPIQ
jgi:hypothetical protein